MKPSELREAIAEAIAIDPWDENNNRVDAFEERVDAILDAVIASLPEPMTEDGEYSYGHNLAMLKVRELLQSAKSVSDE